GRHHANERMLRFWLRCIHFFNRYDIGATEFVNARSPHGNLSISRSARSDFDLLAACFVGLGQVDFENAVLERGVDLAGVDLCGQRDGSIESSFPAVTTIIVAFLFLSLLRAFF